MRVLACIFVAFIGLVSVESCEFKDKMCPLPYDKKMQDEIVKHHNEFRSKAYPAASSMNMMYWDEKMAKIAQAHSEKCKFRHDRGAERAFDGNDKVGQNMYANYRRPSAYDPVKMWHDEVQWFRYGHRSSNEVRHYTQVMRGPASRVGCGSSYCPNLKYKYIVFCNYISGNSVLTPYKIGKPCAKCPKTCKNNLCDCGGKKCKRGSVMDPNTCKCKCHQNTGGELCDKIKCDIKENWACSFYKKNGYCGVAYGYEIGNMCPISCGLC